MQSCSPSVWLSLLLSMKFDYFIIGGGIAGSLLAYKMQARGLRVKLFDHYNPNSSSRVAAGLLNPVTGRRFTLAWKANEVFTELKATYAEMEALSGEKLLQPLKIARLCNSITEYNDWTAKAADQRYHDFVDDGKHPVMDPSKVDDKHGAIYLKQGGYLNTNKTLSFIHHYLGPSFQQVSKQINLSDVKIGSAQVSIDGEEARHLVLADGYLSYQNPFFAYLPFTPMKGEILDLIIPDFYQDRVFIRGGFLIPYGNMHYRAGATYDGKNINEDVTQEAEDNILQRLEKYLKADYSVNAKFAGIRPAVKDRRPLLGTHPKHENVHLFNGFGSKGSSLAPLLADYFINALEQGGALPEEVDIKRYEQLF